VKSRDTTDGIRRYMQAQKLAEFEIPKSIPGSWDSQPYPQSYKQYKNRPNMQ